MFCVQIEDPVTGEGCVKTSGHHGNHLHGNHHHGNHTWHSEHNMAAEDLEEAVVNGEVRQEGRILIRFLKSKMAMWPVMKVELVILRGIYQSQLVTN